MTDIGAAKSAINSHLDNLKKEVEVTIGRPAKVVVVVWDGKECLYAATKNVQRPQFMRAMMQMFDKWLAQPARPKH